MGPIVRSKGIRFSGVAGAHLSAQGQSRNEAYVNAFQPLCPGPVGRAKTLQGTIFYSCREGMWALKTGQTLN